MFLRDVLALALINVVLLLDGAVTSESFKEFGEVFREAKLRNGNGTLSYEAYQTGPEARPKTFRFFTEATSSTAYLPILDLSLNDL